METCKCVDPGCPHCSGECREQTVQILYRIDMVDETGTPMCGNCGADAMESGVFLPAEEES